MGQRSGQSRGILSGVLFSAADSRKSYESFSVRAGRRGRSWPFSRTSLRGGKPVETRLERKRQEMVLDLYYIPARYPNGLPDSIPAKVFTEEVAKTAAALADEIVASIRSELTRLDHAAKTQSEEPDDRGT